MSQIIVENAHTWRLSGELCFANVGVLLTKLTQFSLEGGVLDLRDVTRTDSAGLALLIELLKHSKKAPITFRNIPAQMQSLAAVSGVQEILTDVTHSVSYI